MTIVGKLVMLEEISGFVAENKMLEHECTCVAKCAVLGGARGFEAEIAVHTEMHGFANKLAMLGGVYRFVTRIWHDMFRRVSVHTPDAVAREEGGRIYPANLSKQQPTTGTYIRLL